MPCALAHSRTSDGLGPPLEFLRPPPEARRRDGPPTLRPAAMYFSAVLRSAFEWAALRSISYSAPSRPKWTVPSASPPSMSSMNRVCIFWAMHAPISGWGEDRDKYSLPASLRLADQQPPANAYAFMTRCRRYRLPLRSAFGC